MKTLEMITEGRMQVPMTVSWYLSDIGRAQRALGSSLAILHLRGAAAGGRKK